MAKTRVTLAGQRPEDLAPDTVDFDAYLAAEDDQAPLPLRVGGQVWMLPASLPSSLALRGMRLKAKGKGAELSIKEMNGMIRGMFGRQAEEILDLVPEHKLADLIRMVFDAYAARRSAEGNGQAPAANRAERRSKPKPKGSHISSG